MNLAPRNLHSLTIPLSQKDGLTAGKGSQGKCRNMECEMHRHGQGPWMKKSDIINSLQSWRREQSKMRDQNPPRLWAAREEPRLQWPVASGSCPMATGLGLFGSPSIHHIEDAGVVDHITWLKMAFSSILPSMRDLQFISRDLICVQFEKLGRKVWRVSRRHYRKLPPST